MTTESFFLLCKKANLTINDLEVMTIYMILEYIDAFVSFNNDDTKGASSTRRATQADYDRF